MRKNYKFFTTVFLTVLATTLLTISVGFSALNKDLNISGDIDYEENSNTLYGVLKKAANVGTYAKEYTGSHQDSMAGVGTKKIYHWKADDDTEATTIQDKWNVIFGGFCWQMIRTTDTGGVKLIYNGVPSNGQCNNEGTAQQIGTSAFNTDYTSPADVGYMYNTRYTSNTKKPTSTNVLTITTMTNSTNYYYGTGVTYSSGTYTLTGTTQDTWTNTYSSSSGLYTCRSRTATTCSTVYYIAGGVSSFMYGFSMTGGNLLNYYNTNIVLGTGYTENNGTYTLSGTTTITKADWFNNYSTYKNYYTCGDDSTSCTDLKYITSAGQSSYCSLSSTSNNYIYANDFTYNSGTATYTLSSDRYESWNMTDTDKTNLATHHYTCFNDTGECSTLSYVYYASTPSSGDYLYYVNLTNGKSVEDALDEMLYNDNVNQTNSTIKTHIDNWYQSNMTSYTSYLEDTIFCNDRSQSNQSTNGWNPNGGSVTEYLKFKHYSSNSDLSCTNAIDKFSVSNNKAKLTYPVGLLTNPETYVLSNNNLRKTGQFYWLGSPRDFSISSAYECGVNGYGTNGNVNVFLGNGVRPAVSLKPGTEYSSGTGSKVDPYIVE